MGTLSNFLRRADGAGAAPLSCRPASREEIHPALRLLLGSGGRLADEEAVVDFLQVSLHRGINLNDLWIAERGGRVIWATLPIVSPGRTMLLLVPDSGKPRRETGEDVAGRLVDAACEHFAARGLQLAQVLLDPADAKTHEVYAAHSFRPMAELLYLHIAARRTAPAATLPPGFDWLTYSPAAHAVFAATIAQSYQGSLDCPGLNGVRDIEDVIAGHQSSGGGEFDPSLWFILRDHGKPVAVLLLARTPDGETAELVYLGLVPAARGTGLADVVMRHAIHVVSTTGGHGVLALAVDSRNAPALRLYHRHGLRRVGSKLALMRELNPPRVASPAQTQTVSPDAV